MAGAKRKRRAHDLLDSDSEEEEEEEDDRDISHNTAKAAGSIGMVLRDPSAMHVLLARLVQVSNNEQSTVFYIHQCN